jgi:2-methylisocitrate lyase-like PEP mutase family enzyme
MNEKTQAERAQHFRNLHAAGTFVIANCWDGGSARILSTMGFPALATSSGASAGTLGRLDGNVSIDEAMAQARIICGATSLPVSADLEKGFGDAPAATAKAVALAAGTGLVGGSIEDATGRKDAPIFDLTLATERVAAAVEAARARQGFYFARSLKPADFDRRLTTELSTPEDQPLVALRPVPAI